MPDLEKGNAELAVQIIGLYTDIALLFFEQLPTTDRSDVVTNARDCIRKSQTHRLIQ